MTKWMYKQQERDTQLPRQWASGILSSQLTGQWHSASHVKRLLTSCDPSQWPMIFCDPSRRALISDVLGNRAVAFLDIRHCSGSHWPKHWPVASYDPRQQSSESTWTVCDHIMCDSGSLEVPGYRAETVTDIISGSEWQWHWATGQGDSVTA